MLRSAADAASAAIDYSKGDVEEGVVDSPPSRGPTRTLICSPSPLKRTLSTRGGMFSPASRTEGATSRKLDLLVADVAGHPRLEHDAAHPAERGTVLPTVEQAAIDLVQGDKITKFENLVANPLPRHEDGQSVSS